MKSLVDLAGGQFDVGLFSGPIVSTDRCLKGGRLSEVGQWVSCSWASGVAPFSAPLPQFRSTSSHALCVKQLYWHSV